MNVPRLYRTATTMVCLLVLLSAAPPVAKSAEAKTLEEGEYVMKYGPAEVGSSHYIIREISGNTEKPLIEIATTTLLSATIRKNMKVEFQQKLTALLDGQTLDIRKYTIENESPFKTEKTVMTFSVGEAEVIRTAGGVTVKGTLPYRELPFIADFASPAGGNLNLPLLASMLRKKKLSASDSMTLTALATGSFQSYSLSIEKKGTEAGCLIYEMRAGTEGTPSVYRLYLSAEEGRIMKMDAPDEHFSCALGQGKKITALPDISAAFLIPLTSDLRNCGSVKAKIRLRLLQESVTEDTLKRCNQSFSGSMKDGVLEGTLTVTSMNFKALSSLDFPPSGLDESLKAYLKPEVLIESEDADIRKEAASLTRDAKTIREAVQRIGQWVYETTEFAYTDGSAKATLLAKKGDWIPRNRLFMALLRSLGIPSRFAGGFLLTEKVAGNYVWTEVYFGKEAGWVPVDVALGQIDYISANYLTLGNHMLFDPYTTKPSIEVLQYKEEPRPKGSRFIVR
jgi:hypothetical protein